MLSSVPTREIKDSDASFCIAIFHSGAKHSIINKTYTWYTEMYIEIKLDDKWIKISSVANKYVKQEENEN